MAFDAIVEITGVCAYVPLKNGQIMAVLPDARKPSDEEHDRGMKKHTGVVAWGSFSKTAHGDHHHSGSHLGEEENEHNLENYRNILYLARQRITFKACTENSTPGGNFPKVPDFAVALNDKKFRIIREDVTSDDPPDEVLVQVVIGCGQIEGTNPAHEEGEWNYKWKWDNQADDQAELYAAGMLVRLERLKTLELGIRGFGNGVVGDLKLKPTVGSNELKIMIGNFPIDSSGSSRKRDEHVRWLERFCKHKPPKKPPIPALECPKCVGTEVPSRTCFGLQFDLE